MIQLVDNGQNIDFTENGHTQGIPKEGLEIELFSDGRFEFTARQGQEPISFYYAEVSAPSTDNAEALRVVLNGYLRSGSTRTVTSIAATSTGTVAAGAFSVSVFNNGGIAGTWNGVTLPVRVSKTHEPVANGVYSAIAYDATGTTFLIDITT
jgi:hypothetical protein